MILSIVVAAYNVENSIQKCLLSCLEQDIPIIDYEIIVINDGSKDNTQQIVESLSSKIPNLKLINKKNGGLGTARNAGIQNSSGEFIWMIDGDDYIEENILSQILSKIKINDLDALSLNYNIVDDNYTITIPCANELKLKKEVLSGPKFYKDNYEKSYTWFYIFKKSLFKNSNILFKERINMQDSEILPKLMFHIQRISFLEKACYFYVQHPDSFTNSNSGEKRFKYFESIMEVNESLNNFMLNEAKDNLDLMTGVKFKIESLNQVVFNHLVFFKYESDYLIKIINLLKKNDFYPLKYSPSEKLKILKLGLNNYPISTKRLIDKIRKIKNRDANK
jgi:glycosyltransferase involved in cell wall biosynthesis